MKKNKKESKKVVITRQTVGVERKKDVILIQGCIDKMTEDEIRELVMKMEAEKKALRNVYYSLNTPIVKTRQRSFWDLTKKFFRRVGDSLDVRLNKVPVK
jgi:hypothetical protein